MIINHYNDIKVTLEEIRSDYNPYIIEQCEKWNSINDVIEIIEEKISEFRR